MQCTGLRLVMVKESAREIERIHDMYFIYTHPLISIHPSIHHIFPKECRNEGRNILITIFFLCVLLKNRIFNVKHPIKIIVFHQFYKLFLHLIIQLLMLKMLSSVASIQSFEFKSWVFTKSRPSSIQFLVKKNSNLTSSFHGKEMSKQIMPIHMTCYHIAPILLSDFSQI